MKKEKKLAYEYGQAASTSACPFAPWYNPCMRELISEARSEAAHQRSQENMRAWYMGYLSQTALAGNGISQEMFTTALTALIDCKPESASTWIRFAAECVDLGQYVEFALENDHDLAVSRWLETLLSGLLETQRQYGARIAKQVCDLALLSNCLYPGEMTQAAAHFQNGGSPEDICGMIESGAIEGNQPFFPKLTCEIGENRKVSPYASMAWQITGM